jgi:membrane protein YdbS with pleckstrin-like domain
VAFQEEQLIARIRRSWWRLVFPLLSLFIAATLFSYVNNRAQEQWLVYLCYSIAGVLAVVFWLIPSIRHLSFYVELTTSRLIVRDGIFGQKTIELSLSDITGIELGRGRVITISRREVEPLALQGLPKAKTFVAELRSAARI